MEEVFTVTETKPEVKAEAPKVEEVNTTGWSAKDIAKAQERGLLAKPEEKKEAPKVEPNKDEVKAEEQKKPEEKKVEKSYGGSLHLDNVDLTPEQEKALFDAFPNLNGRTHPVKALYIERRGERLARQKILAEKKEIEARLAVIEAAQKQGPPPAPEVDENGQPIDPDNKPLTMKQLKEMRQAEIEEAERKSREQGERAALLVEAQRAQESYAREIYTDFDDTLKKAAEVMQNMDEIVPEKWKQAKLTKMIRDLQIAAANAHELGIDDYNAAHIAYEIGQFHPDYGRTNGKAADSNGKPKDPKQASGGLTPEQMKRAEENTQRRTSSASIPGGGASRKVTPDEVTLTDYSKMTPDERWRFRQKYPERYKSLRG